MTGIPRLGRSVLGHERHGLAVLGGDLPDPLLEDDVTIGHFERFGVAEVDFVLAAAPFPLAVLDRHACLGEAVPDRTHQPLVPRRLHQVIPMR
jgi:hypothetical protein